MADSKSFATPLPVDTDIPPSSLRATLERRRAAGQPLSLSEVIAIAVPLCTELRARHEGGARFYLSASAVVLDDHGTPSLSLAYAQSAPLLPRDRASMAPETRGGTPGDARASVYTVGALLYEMLTGEVVGPGMRRPTELVPDLDPRVEAILGKALIGDRAHRPDDLGALAQALHQLAPQASVPPPPADASALDEGEDFEVDVSLSMLPPPPAPAASVPKAVADPYAVVVTEPARPKNDPTTKLADLKARLESDPRPRYVVVKDGMDHGPFTAVELLQQIASHQFLGEHVLRDAFSKDERPIDDWEEFAPFAEQAQLAREIIAEKKAVEQVARAEAKGTKNKTILGLGLVGGLLAIVAVVIFRSQGTNDDSIAVHADEGIAIETDAGIKVDPKRAQQGVRRAGGVPQLAGGMSCEAARDRYVEEIKIGGGNGPADLTANQFASVLNHGGYIAACGTPDSTKVNICAAVQNGRAVGVTVTTNPPNASLSNCIAGKIRAMSFPVHHKLDIVRTTF